MARKKIEFKEAVENLLNKYSEELGISEYQADFLALSLEDVIAGNLGFVMKPTQIWGFTIKGGAEMWLGNKARTTT